jgi:phytanoyl-CoA hydroxylase
MRRVKMDAMKTSTLTHSLEPAPQALSEEQIEQFHRDGYLAFSDVFTPEEVAGARSALTELLQKLIADGYEHSGNFWTHVGGQFRVQFEKGYTPDISDPDLELKLRKFQRYVNQHPLLQSLECGGAVRNVVESLIGPSPIMFQDMALVKPPFIGREKPWHQDNAYFAVEPLSAVVGVWIALDDATVRNGCMHILPGGHLEGARKHVLESDCEIPREKIDESRIVPVEIPAGGAMFFAGMLPHQTPPNISPERRRALQWHYRAADSAIIPREEYNKLFSIYDEETGKIIPASCADAKRIKLGL